MTTVRLEDFFDRLGTSNPFTDNRSSGPAVPEVDVTLIHQSAFQRLIGLAEEASQERRGLGAVLWGEAGIGKSHLLARLSGWAAREHSACFAYLHNLQASPANLPRSLLRTVVSILTAGQVRWLTRTPLWRLLFQALKRFLQADPNQTYRWPEIEAGWTQLVDRLALLSARRAVPVDRTVFDVFFRFFKGAVAEHRGLEVTEAPLALRWLGGDTLDAPEARRLGLRLARHEDATALADNQQIKQVLVSLTQLAALSGQPFLLCFDQVDNLDPEQAGALSRFLEALLDSSDSLLVVTAGIQATLLHWRETKVIQDSAWDRLAQFEVALHRIGPEAGRQLLTARLRRFLQPFLDLEPIRVRAEDDPLFPLGRVWAAEFFRDRVEVRPRDVLNAGREAWRRLQEEIRGTGGPAWLETWKPQRPGADVPTSPVGQEELRLTIDRKVARVVAELESQRHQEPATLPADAGNLSGLVFQLLEQWRQVDPTLARWTLQRPETSRAAQQSPYHFLIGQDGTVPGSDRRLGVRFLITGSANTTVTELRRLVRDPEPPDRVLIVTDERQPPPRAARGKAYLQELIERGGHHFQERMLTFGEYAHLDALQAVVGLARSGDLEVEWPLGQTRRVTDKEVMEAHHRAGRYQQAAVLRDLLLQPEAVAAVG